MLNPEQIEPSDLNQPFSPRKASPPAGWLDPHNLPTHTNTALGVEADIALPEAAKNLHPTVRQKLQIFEDLEQHPDLLDAALKLENAIPVWFGDHTISFRDGKLSVEIRAGWEPLAAQKAADEKAFTASTNYPVEVTWIKRPPLPSQPPLQLVSDTPEPFAPEPGGDLLKRREIEDIIRTAPRPAGVDVGWIRFTRRFTNPDSLHLALVTVIAKDGTEAQIKPWRDELEKKFAEAGAPVGILIKLENAKEDSADRLQPFADRYGVIRDFSKLPDIETLVHGAPRPPVTAEQRTPLPELDVADITSMPMIAIDPDGAKDPEDAIYEEPLSNGNRMMVVAICLNRRFGPGSPQAEWAEHAGESLYGRLTSIPLFPNEFSWDEFALVEGKPRYALVGAMEITPDQKVVKKQLTIAKVENHRQLSFDDANRIIDGDSDPVRDQLLSMRDLVTVIKKRPFQTVRFNLPDNDGTRIVTNTAIANKYIVASEAKKRGIEIMFQVHAKLNDELSGEFLEELEAAGIEASPEDFDDSIRFRELIGRVAEKKEAELANKMLDAVFERGSFRLENWGHEYLKVDAYAPVKTRLFSGWVNQQQLLAALRGETAFTHEELVRMEESANKANRRNDYDGARLRVFEEVLAHRDQMGKEFSATVNRVYSDEVWITVPGYYRWGAIKFKRGSDDAKQFNVGDEIKVKMDGYDVRKDRFRFRLK